MKSFRATIEIIGVNPYVYLPEAVLNYLFKQAKKNKGPIPVCGTIDGHSFIQTLVKYQGAWRLYINGPMLKNAKKGVGEIISISLEFDPKDRSIAMHPKLEAALKNNSEANRVFSSLPASRKKEIIRYISFLKSEDSVEKNIKRAIDFLLGNARFIGRDKP